MSDRNRPTVNIAEAGVWDILQILLTGQLVLALATINI